MKPDYALSLSFEGIGLLARAAGGWRVAGDVSLDAPDLGGALADLRQRAADLGGPAFRTKLIIPNDQIRYLSVDTGHVSTADRIDQVRAALDGATPYAVADLVYDICVDGAVTHVAAVARETLEEAENFAQEHRFHPVSFVAIPTDAAFLGEPFFGPTRFSQTALASGERVEPDGVAVVVVGPLENADGEDTLADEGVELEPLATFESLPEPEPEAEPKAPPVASEVSEPAPPVTADPTPIPTAPEPVTQGMAEDAAPMLGFSSRRGTKREDTPEATTAPAIGGATRSTISPRIDDDEAPTEKTPEPGELAASLDAPEEQPTAAPGSVAKAWAARFLSRRGAPAAEAAAPEVEAETAAPVAALKAEPELTPDRATAMPSPVAMAPSPAATLLDPSMADERTRMTIFGMRETPQTRGTPKHLGLILTAVLLLFLAGVAAWASVFMDDGVSSFFDRDEPVRAAQVPKLPDSAVPTPTEPEAATEEVAALDPGETGLTETDAAVLDALREPEPLSPTELSPEEADARYAVTGIWQRAPETPAVPGVVTLDDLYLTSIDGSVDARDAVALPQLASFDTDVALGQVISPVAPGSEFAFDENGRVLPTPEGALSPDGFTVFLGRPPVTPPATPTRFETTPETDAIADEVITVRPRPRPGDLVEQTERTQLGGLTREELSDLRPRLRPLVEKTEEEADETPTAQAVFASLAPRERPSNMASLVDRAQRSTTPTTPEATPVAAPAATVTPRIPSTASVARAATVNNAINLRRVNLIGVYGTPSNRRALVRMPNGRYKKVQVGDRLDGGRISAIGDNELRYQKNGRNLTLKMPSG